MAKVLSRPTSKPVLRKANGARAINKAIDKKIAEKRKEADYYYKESRAIRPKSNEKVKSRDAAERKYLSNSYYRRSEEAKQYANKLEGQYRVTNKKDLSKSLGAVASNKGMKKADVKGTVKLAEKTLSDAKQKLRTHDASMGGTKQQHDALKKQVKAAEKNLKSLNKTASKRK